MKRGSLEAPIQLAGCALINSDAELFALRRIKRGWWELPGGKVRDGETLAQAADREAFEETGSTVKIVNPQSPIDQFLFSHNGQEYSYTTFRAEPSSGRPKVTETDVHDESGYFGQLRLMHMRAYLAPHVESLLLRIIDGEIKL